MAGRPDSRFPDARGARGAPRLRQPGAGALLSPSPESLLADLGLSAYRPLEGVWGEELQAVIEGPGGEKLLLKEKRGYLSEAELRFHLDLHRFLASRSAPVAPLPAGLIDRLPLDLSRERFFEAQVWLGGRRANPASPEDMAAAAGALAWFHQGAAAFPWPGGAVEHQEPRDRFGKAEYYRPYLSRALQKPDHPLLTALYGRLAEARTAVMGGRGEDDQPLHGDPAPDNFLLTPEECLLIDLDDAHFGPPASDLAWLLTMTAALRWGGDGECLGVREGWDPDLSAAVLDGYPERPERLGPWRVASLVCAVVDCLTHRGEPAVPREEMEESCRRALRLIETMEEGTP